MKLTTKISIKWTLIGLVLIQVAKYVGTRFGLWSVSAGLFATMVAMLLFAVEET